MEQNEHKRKNRNLIIVLLIALLMLAISFVAFKAFSKYAFNVFTNQEITLKDASIAEAEITLSPSSWTNGNVTVTITTTKTGGSIYYKNGASGTWTAYTAPFQVSDNTTIYARLQYSDGNGPTTTKVINNIERTAPQASITSTNNLSNSQTVVLLMDDNVGLASYYWGTQNPETEEVTWTNNNQTSVNKTVSEAGTYYLGVKDQAGNTTYVHKDFYLSTFTPNKGTVSQATILTMEGNTFNLPTPSAVTGYTFSGWYTAALAGTKIGDAGASYTPSATTTLQGQWTANDYTVTFDANGGTVSQASKSVTYDSSYGSLPTPTRVGYTFQGWNGKNLFDLNSSYHVQQNRVYVDDGKVVFDGSAYANNPMSDIRIQKYYNSIMQTNGADIKSFSHPETGRYSVKIDKTSDFDKIAIRGNTTRYDPLMVIDIPLENGQSYILSFDVDYYNREESKVILNNIQLEVGNEATAYEPYYVASSTTVTQAQNHTLTAKWTVNQYTATFNANGGTTPIPTTVTRDYGTQLGGENQNLFTSNSTTPGYAYYSLSTNPMTKELVDDETSPSGKAIRITRTTAGTREAGYYYDSLGRLSEGQTYTIKFKAKGSGTWSVGHSQGGRNEITPTNEYVEYTKTFVADSNSSTRIVIYESGLANGAWIQFQPISITCTMPHVTNNGYYFDGWWTSASGGTEVDEDSTMPAENPTYYAHWTARTYSVTLDNQSATTVGTGTMYYKYNTNKYYSDSNTTTEISSITVPEKTGYTFGGYYTSANGGGTKCIDENGDVIDSLYAFAGNRTLYAKWTPNQYDVTYMSGNLMYGLEDCEETESNRMTYSINDGVVTVTANNNDGYGTTTGRVYLEAGKTYKFSCETDGVWGNQSVNNGDSVEALVSIKGWFSSSDYWVSFPSNEYIFTPEQTATYKLRLDVNKNGETHTFSNISIYEVVRTDTKDYGSTLGTLPAVSRTGYTLDGWYDAKSGGNEISSSTTVPANDVTYYAHWTANNYTATFLSNLVANGDFSNGTSGWKKSNEEINTDYEIDTTLKYENKNSMRISTASNGFYGVNSTYDIDYKPNTTYKISYAAYRDSSSEFGDLTREFRVYLPEYREDGSRISYHSYAALNVTSSKLPDKTWTKFSKTITTSSDGVKFDCLRLDYMMTNGQTNIWIADVKVEEVATKTVACDSKIGTLPTTTRTGYTSGGYYTGENGSGTRITADTLMGPSDITYYEKWTAKTNTAYTVKHYQMDLDGTNYTLVDTDNLTGTTNSEVTPSVKNYTGFTAPATQTVSIKGDGSTVVEYRYTRNKYNLDLNGWLDGASSGNITGYGTADVYVNNKMVGTARADYCVGNYYGSTYEIKNITVASGKKYNGVHSGS
ncbi:MAG: InlB B-repeat-containing protein, partial [Clostridia bacterium]|nr:InlB B-repeat-containing protein [Clostridia bacterium]